MEQVFLILASAPTCHLEMLELDMRKRFYGSVSVSLTASLKPFE